MNTSPGVYTSVKSVAARAAGDSGTRILVIGTNAKDYTPSGGSKVVTPKLTDDVYEITSQKELIQICGDPTAAGTAANFTASPAVRAAYIILQSASKVFFKSLNTVTTVEEVTTESDVPTAASIKTAIESVADVDSYAFDFIICPEAASLGSNGYNDIFTVLKARKDCILVMDSQVTISGTTYTYRTPTQEVSDNTALVDSDPDSEAPYCAKFYPWLKYTFSKNQKDVPVAISAFIVAKEAENQKLNNVWDAVAGFKRGSVLNATPVTKLLQSDRDSLYEASVNPVSIYRGQGPIILGNKTNYQAADTTVTDGLEVLSVVRMVNAIKKTIATYAGQILFDQGGEYLWAEFKNLVTPYLDSVKNGGGLEDYAVVMDSSNNTEDDVNKGVAYGNIILDPTFPCERIILEFTISPAGVSFN